MYLPITLNIPFKMKRSTRLLLSALAFCIVLGILFAYEMIQMNMVSSSREKAADYGNVDPMPRSVAPDDADAAAQSSSVSIPPSVSTSGRTRYDNFEDGYERGLEDGEDDADRSRYNARSRRDPDYDRGYQYGYEEAEEDDEWEDDEDDPFDAR